MAKKVAKKAFAEAQQQERDKCRKKLNIEEVQ